MTNPRSENRPQPYAPSWINRLTAWVGRLPGPSWLYYLGLGVALFLAQAIVLWVEGAFPSGTLPAFGYLAGAIAFILALFHYLDEWAGGALATLRPALNTGEQGYSELHYQLTKLPARSTLLASLAVLTTVLLTEVIGGGPYRLDALDTFPISANLLRVLYLLCWWVWGAFIPERDYGQPGDGAEGTEENLHVALAARNGALAGDRPGAAAGVVACPVFLAARAGSVEEREWAYYPQEDSYVTFREVF